MKITQRQSAIGILGLQAALALLMLGSVLWSGGTPASIAGTAVGGLLMLGLLVAYIRGWEGARHTAVVIITLLTAFLLPEPYLTQQVALSIMVAPVLALILTSPVWVLGSTVVIIGALVGRANGHSVYVEPGNILGISAVVCGMILARLVADSAQHSAQESATRAETERVRAEQRAAELDETTKRLEEELTRQRALLSLVDTLETPVVRLAETVLFAPVVGRLDARRADALMSRLLDAVHRQSCRTMIIDIAGVAMVDAEVATALVRTVKGLQLLGCDVVVSGISAQVAATLVQLNASLSAIRTVRSPEEALANVVAVQHN